MTRKDKTVSLSRTGPVEDRLQGSEADLDLGQKRDRRAELTARLRAERKAREDSLSETKASDTD